MTPSKRNLLLIIALSAILFIPWLGLREFHTRGEPREALAIRSVSDGKNFLLPREYGEILAAKPPLMYWLGGAASRIKGETSEYSSRIPSAVTAVLFVAGLYLFLAPRVGERGAFLSCLILTTTAEWFRHAIVSRVDLLLAATMASSLIFSYLDFEKKRRLPSLFTILFASLAVLSKGPIGIILPLFIIGTYLLLRRNSFGVVTKYLAAFTIGGFLIPSIWYGLAFKEGGEEFWNLVVFENFQRFLGNGDIDTPHHRSAIAFYGTVLLGLFPWSVVLLPELLERAFSGFKKWRHDSMILSLSTRKERVNSFLKVSYWSELFSKLASFIRTKADESSDIKLFCSCAVICTLLFFSFSSGKRSVYALPCYPFIAILISSYLLHLTRLRHRYVAWSFFGFALLASTFCVGAVVASFIELRTIGWVDLSAPIRISIISGILLTLVLIFSIWILVKILYASRRSYVPAGLSLIYTLFLLVHASISPLIADSLSPEGFARAINREINPSEPINSFKYEFYGVSFYSNRLLKTVSADFNEGMLILLFERDLTELSQQIPSELNVKTILRSARQIEIPGEHAVVVRLEKAI